MAETDWREILSFSQRELTLLDKEKLCESLCWMEADDIELNFTDLKTLFRLSQDILKLKSEQVNNLTGQLKTSQRKGSRTKLDSPYAASPTQSNDSALETITHQEEIIRANKEILEQLYADIADLESRKSKLEESTGNLNESESSRDALSEMNAVAELENEVSMKNKHIRKLLTDVKILEDENTKLKEKVSVLKEKLTEATQLINNLTEQMVTINNECSQLKDILGQSEQKKAQLSVEIENLKKELSEKDSKGENINQDLKSKVQHWKNIAKSRKAEAEALSNENQQLKNDILKRSRSSLPLSPKKNHQERLKIKELQEKLLEASTEIEETANIINSLRSENRQLKALVEDVPDVSTSERRNESDDGKEQALITKLRKKNKTLSASLQAAEEMIAAREKELLEITSQLQLLQSDEGMNALLEGLKSKKRQLKFKEEGIKNLVLETNTLNELVNELQLENEALRQKLNIPLDEKIPTKGIMKEYRDLKGKNSEIRKELKKLENKLVELGLKNHVLKSQLSNLSNFLSAEGHTEDKIKEIAQNEDMDYSTVKDNAEGTTKNTNESPKTKQPKDDETENLEKEMTVLIEENKGLRKGLQEILDFLKDNSTTSSGVLTLQCPSLESVLISMEARNTAGWFAPHMSTVMELRAALGGKDALLTALHEARKETFEVMTQLNEETKKASKLEQKLNEIELINEQKMEEEKRMELNADVCEFGSWISDKEQTNINIYDKSEIENLMQRGNSLYECQLRKGLEYFHKKFKDLFDKLTTMSVQMSDNRNSWSIQEEHFKAEIENLKIQLQQEDEEFSDVSPGMIPMLNTNALQRKCSYLEESYRHIRTLNENMKNEILETKKDAMTAASDYENRIQQLILSVANLTDKLRCSISYDLFWKQNLALNELTSKYRSLLENNMSYKINSEMLLKRLEDSKLYIMDRMRTELQTQNDQASSSAPKTESDIAAMVLHKQIEQLTLCLGDKDKEIDTLQSKISELQEAQGKVIDENLSSMTKEEICLIKEQLKKLTDDNKILHDQCQHTTSQLDIALLQLQDAQQRQMSRDMEINMLEHQILDLQSTSDSKAIMSRLSGEILIAHLQASDSYKRIERLTLALNKEKVAREEAEEMLRARQKIFDVYALRYDSKFKYMFDVMQTLRQQYQGSIPRASIENFLNEIEDLSRKNHAMNEKLSEVDDLRTNLIAKLSVFHQILDISKEKCLMEEDSCPHKLKYIVSQSITTRELEHTNKKLKAMEQSREEIIRHCNNLEKNLVLLNQGFGKSSIKDFLKIDTEDSNESKEVNNLTIEDIQSDDDSDSSRGSKTITLSKPLILKQPKPATDPREGIVNNHTDSPIRTKPKSPKRTFVYTMVQTTPVKVKKSNRLIQTDDREEPKVINESRNRLSELQNIIDRKSKELTEAMTLIQKRSEENLKLNKEKIGFEYSIENLKDSNNKKDNIIENLRTTINELRKQTDELKVKQLTESNKIKDDMKDENKSLLQALKQLENDKIAIEAEYKDLLNNEREEYSKSVKELHTQLMDAQAKLDRRGSEATIANGKEMVTKYTMKIAELEDKSFKLKSELDECKAELITYQSEAERWKDLASERLTKMEQLNLQLEERHCQEVKSYKAENQHWMSQLNDMQREHMDLRTRLTDQKTAYIKQLGDKDTQIEQLRVVVNNLKTQVMNMQTLISVNDPSFDLSAIVEVDETNDVLSQHGSDRLELKFDSTVDFHESQDEIVRIPASSTTIWQEPVIERLRREKQMASKQNTILRRQIKVLAARERRARLDAQNLKNQVFRITTNGNKVTSSETAGLHNKIASLQAQLTSARRDTHSSIALWDKWKRSQQAADRWQARFEEKNQEVLKLEANLHLAKCAVTRLEKEKRMLLTRLNEAKSENQLTAIEKQEAESPEKSHRSSRECVYSSPSLPVSSQALLDRVEAQQRRIAALEVAEKGNELLVSEYERSLAEITSLKGQVLKLESTLLESQIRTPLKSVDETQPELEYWKNYCQMLKEENVQLTHKINSLETLPTTAHQHRVNDLEQTVLTLRGVIHKLQSEQKSGVVHKRVDSRPNSSRSGTDKGRTQLESHRIEIVNLKRTIHDKDLLLEKSKEMLKIAAEREDELLRENTYLRRQIEELTRPKGGFLSA